MGVGRALRASALLLGAGGGEDSSGGPRARILAFTGCHVPSGAVRVHDHIGGDAEQFVVHAKTVIPKEQLPGMLESCGTTDGALQRGYDTHPMLPEAPLAWWSPPDRQLVRGVRLEQGSRVVEIVAVERDTDYAVYLKSVGREE